MTIRLGAHVDSIDPLADAAALGAEVVQIFLGDPQSWKAPACLVDGGAPALKAAAEAAGVGIVVHSPYALNVASANNRIRIPSRKLLQQSVTEAAAVGALFADPNIGRDAVYIADGGAPVLVRVVARRADVVSDFGDARLWSETTRIDLRVAEVANPRPGDRIEIEGEPFLIQGEPIRDRERLVWTVDLRPT